MGCGCSKAGPVREVSAQQAKPKQQSEAARAEVLRVLSSFDEPLVEALRRGDICLVRSSWVRLWASLSVGGRPTRIKRRQDLGRGTPAFGTR